MKPQGDFEKPKGPGTFKTKGKAWVAKPGCQVHLHKPGTYAKPKEKHSFQAQGVFENPKGPGTFKTKGKALVSKPGNRVHPQKPGTYGKPKEKHRF